MAIETRSGRCLCGACHYEIDGPLDTAGVCYCEDCRRVTGSAFGVSVRVLKSNLRLSGETRAFTKAAESGARLARHFCGTCGSPLYTASDRHPEAVFIKAGSLDDGAALVIDRVMWIRSKANWADIPASAKIFDKGRM